MAKNCYHWIILDSLNYFGNHFYWKFEKSIFPFFNIKIAEKELSKYVFELIFDTVDEKVTLRQQTNLNWSCMIIRKKWRISFGVISLHCRVSKSKFHLLTLNLTFSDDLRTAFIKINKKKNEKNFTQWKLKLFNLDFTVLKILFNEKKKSNIYRLRF